MSDYQNKFIRQYAWLFLMFLVAILIFCVILIPREIQILKTFSVLARYNTTRFVPMFSVLLFAALIIKNERLSQIISAALIFAAFALALNGLWAGAYSENSVIAGLIPRKDALSFYSGAVSLKESGYLVNYAKHRPLFGTFLAFILWITGGNLQITLAVITFLFAAISYFSVIAVRRALNPPAAVLYFIIIYLFIRRHIGITMSESMGILLGISAFTFFLVFLGKKSKDHQKSVFYFLFGVFVYALAQAARPGAIATLPLLILLAGWLWKGNKKISWKWMLITASVILISFLINSAIFNLTTLPGVTKASNIGFGIYGLAVGGKGWEQIYIDHPEINLLVPGDFEQEIMRIVWQEISTHPGNFIKGMLVQFKILFSFSPSNSIYSFVWSKNTFFSVGLIALFFVLSICGSISVYINRKKELGLLTIVCLLGFLFSLPFAPAYQTQYMRVYAASLPFLGFLPAYGLAAIIRLLPEKAKKFFDPKDADYKPQPTGVIIFSTCLTLILITGPFFTKAFAPSSLSVPPGCDQDQDEVVMRLYPGSSIRILRNDPSIMTWVPTLTQLDYKGSIHNICCEDEILYFENIPAPNVLYPALNLLTGKEMYMVVDESMLPDEFGLIHICGRIENVHGEKTERGFLYPQTLQLLD